jgi:hypothetical protein
MVESQYPHGFLGPLDYRVLFLAVNVMAEDKL